MMSAMQQNFITVESLDMLEAAFAKLEEYNCHTLPVILNRSLVRFAHNWNNGTMEQWNIGTIGVPSG
jgi:hypothetical protein